MDGLRGYLALSVLAHHFIIWMQTERLGGTWSPPTVGLFNNLGAGGVALFFMTTGLVFYPRVLAGFAGTSWPALYVGRVARIVPLIAVSVAIILAIVASRGAHTLRLDLPLRLLRWIAAWDEPDLLGYPDTGRLNAYVLWSLWYEWLFYIFVLPACALAAQLVRGRLPSWIVPAGLLAGSLLLQLVSRRPLVHLLPFFAIGMLAFECRRHERIRALAQTPWMALFACAALLLGLIRNKPPDHLGQWPLYGIFFVTVACGNGFGGLLRTRGALALGECSYGIYLLHGIALGLLFVEGRELAARFDTAALPILLPVVAALLVPVTALTYLVVERPAMALGRRLSGRLSGRQIPDGSPQVEVAP